MARAPCFPTESSNNWKLSKTGIKQNAIVMRMVQLKGSEIDFISS